MENEEKRVYVPSAHSTSPHDRRIGDSRPSRTYREPTSIDDAEQRYRDLVYDISVIQMQMSDDARKNKMTRAEFSLWRTKAMGARINKADEMIWLKDWIRKRRISLEIEDAADTTERGLLLRTSKFFKRLHEEEFDFSDAEKKLWRAIDDHLNHVA